MAQQTVVTDGVAIDLRLRDVFTDDGYLMHYRLSDRAHERYDQALWYCFGRQDAGDDRTNGLIYGRMTEFMFAEWACCEAEAYERQYVTHLGPISQQYDRFVAVLSDGNNDRTARKRAAEIIADLREENAERNVRGNA